jgi:hypothetical protein
MAQKKSRAWFTCPRWTEIAGSTPTQVSPKTVTLLKAGKPMARSTIRRALLMVRQTSGSLLDVDELIVDQRLAR